MFSCTQLGGRSAWVAVALAVILADSSFSHAQMHNFVLRGQPAAMGGTPMFGFPGLPGIPLANNGTLQISRNPNPTFPNATPFAYIAALPLGDRLPYNGILADPQMTPQTQVGQQLQQNILLNLQTQQFGPNANPFNLQSQALQQPQLGPFGNPIGTPVPGFIGWGASRPNYAMTTAMMNYVQMNMAMAYASYYQQAGANIYGTGMGSSSYFTPYSYGQSASDFYTPLNGSTGFNSFNTNTNIGAFGAGFPVKKDDNGQKQQDGKDPKDKPAESK